MASAAVGMDGSDERRLVSPASILILSAFLAGVAFAEALPRTAQVHAMCAAAAGVAAFFGLWYTTRLQERLASTQQDLRIVRRLEKRLGKHVRERKSQVTGVVRRFGTYHGG